MTIIKKHVKISAVFWAVFTMFFISTMLWCGSIICQNVYESLTPTNRRFTYTDVRPIKQVFAKWEDLTFKSKTIIYKDISMRREDAAYCGTWPNSIMQKHRTQFWPSEIWFEYKKVWRSYDKRKYKYSLDDDDKYCEMCVVVIWKTPLWYIKTYDYCTEIFGVNK